MTELNSLNENLLTNSSCLIEEVGPTRRKLLITVPSNIVSTAINDISSNVQKTTEIRGFRKGKAPIELIKKFHMSDIIQKAADKVVRDAYSESVKNIDFQIISQPQIEPDNQFDGQTEFKFSAVVDINPKVDIQGYKGLDLKLPTKMNPNIEEEVEKHIARLKEELAKTPDVNLNDMSDEEIAKRLGHKDMTEIRETVKKGFQDSLEDARVNESFESIVEQLIAKNPIEVAESLIENTIDKLMMEEFGDSVDRNNVEMRNSFREKAIHTARGVLILGHIARQEAVEVSQFEVISEMSRFMQENRINPNTLRQHGSRIFDEFSGQVTVRKAVLKILETANIEYVDEEKNREPEDVLLPKE